MFSILAKGVHQKQILHKILLQIPVSYLYQGVIQLEKNWGLHEVWNKCGNVIAGYAVLRYLMPIQVQWTTESHKVTCGYETCISANILHASLFLIFNN